MDALERHDKKVGQQCKSDQASNCPFDTPVLPGSNHLSNSNDNFDSHMFDENREYTPAEVLDWETEIYKEEDLPLLQSSSFNDENEEKKSKSTVDSTERGSSK